MKSTVLVKHTGHEVPQEHIIQMLKETGANCFGIAGFSSNGLLLKHWPALQEVGENPEEIAKAIMDLQADYKDGIMLMSFSDIPGQVTASDDDYDTPHMMPFSILSDEDGVPHLVATLVGDFSRWDQKDIPGSAVACREDLAPRIAEMLTDKDGDLDKLVTALRGSQVFQRDLMKLSTGETGMFTFLTSGGEMITHGKVEGGLLHHTGWWSTFNPKAAAPASVTAKPKLSLTDKAKQFLGKPPAATVVNAPAQTMPKTDTAPVQPKVTVELYQPDAAEYALLSNKEKKNLYKRKVGWTPDDWRNRPKVEVRIASPIKDLRDLKTAMVENGSATEVKPVEGKAGQFEIKAKDPAAQHVKPDNKPIENKTPWLIPAEIREKIMKDGVVLKIVGRSSEIINSIEKIKEEEAKYPSFSEQLPKIGLEGLLACTPTEFEKLVYEYPETVTPILIAYRSVYVKLKDMEKANALAKATLEAAPPTKPKLSMTKAA